MKKLSIVLVACLLLATFAACGSSDSSASSSDGAETESISVEEISDNTEETSEASAEEETDMVSEETDGNPVSDAMSVLPITEELTTITVWTGVAPDMVDILDSYDQMSVVRQLEALTNIHLDATLVSAMDQDTKFPLMIASGDYTDVIAGAEGNYSSGADGLVAEEICIDISDLIEEYSPNYYNFLSQDDKLYKATITDSGTMASYYSFYTEPIYDSTKSANHWIRNDWLEELGLDMPTTYDALHDVLTAFYDNYGAVMVISSDANEYILGYGISDTFYLNDDGDVAYGGITDTYREYLTMLSEWYAEGLIYEDFYAYSTSALSDTAIYVTDGTGVFEYTSNNLTTLYNLMDDGVELDVVAMPEPTISEGDLITVGFENIQYNGATWTITTACEQVETVMAYIDYMYTDECADLWAYGLEDEAFYYDENGDKQFTDLILNNPDGYSQLASFYLYTMSGMSGFPGLYNYFISSIGWTQAQWDAFDIWPANYGENVNQYPADAKMTEEESSTYAGLYTNIETYQEEMLSKFIVGGEDITDDEVWNTYVTSLEDMGVSDCVAIKQASYDRYKER